MARTVVRMPRYRKLYEILRKHIVEGVYQEGDLLPSENELCKVYNLTRPTVRHALDALVHDGYIKKQQGKGSIVHQLPKGVGILSIAGTTSALGSRNLETRIIVKPRVQAWPDPFMFRLGEEEKESGCIYMERLRLFNKDPIFYDINFIPNINMPRFTSRNFENRSLFDILRQHYRIRIKGGEQKLRAIGSGKKISRYLNLPVGDPVLHLERKFDTDRVKMNIYSSIYCNTRKQAVYGIF